jgi:hypothetical protein
MLKKMIALSLGKMLQPLERVAQQLFLPAGSEQALLSHIPMLALFANKDSYTVLEPN